MPPILTPIFVFLGQARGDFATTINIWAHTSKTPQIVVHCATSNDVQAGLTIAREAGLPVSVRAGGHDWVGRALCDGVVLDLTPMRWAEVSQDRATVRIGGGSRGMDVYTLFAIISSGSNAGMTSRKYSDMVN
ncbi:FAD-binding protein [Devosia sp. UYZn731]|uniref:FAD-binding oxidoreductase n=1 Tax=Devosia sp. UYZn731 TaxID=3156345 RepID=UPI003393609E